MEDMAVMVNRAEASYIKQARCTEDYQLLQAYYVRCRAIVDGFAHAVDRLSTNATNSVLSPPVFGALQSARVWMASTYGEGHVPTMDAMQREIREQSKKEGQDGLGISDELGLLAQIVGSVLIETNLRHPNGASGGIYPLSVFKMGNERMLLRVQCANKYLGVEPLVLRSGGGGYGGRRGVSRPTPPRSRTAQYVLGVGLR